MFAAYSIGSNTVKDIAPPIFLLLGWLFITDVIYCLEKRRDFREDEGRRFVDTLVRHGYGDCYFRGYSNLLGEAKLSFGVHERPFLRAWEWVK